MMKLEWQGLSLNLKNWNKGVIWNEMMWIFVDAKVVDGGTTLTIILAHNTVKTWCTLQKNTSIGDDRIAWEVS